MKDTCTLQLSINQLVRCHIAYLQYITHKLMGYLLSLSKKCIGLKFPSMGFVLHLYVLIMASQRQPRIGPVLA